ncbi:MAG: matrixin family metalloprotease [Sulfuricurvum sp.]|nr:matrixin family metalloprotease [Sulfuricurvum sp.]
MAHYQQVKIGSISSKYSNSLSEKQLYTLIQEIKTQFDRQLGYSVFEYSENGLPINILFANESQKRKMLKRYEEEIVSIQKHINMLDTQITDERNILDRNQETLNAKVKALNQSIQNLNSYISQTNSTVSSLSKEQYASIKQKVETEHSIIEQTKKGYEQNRARHNRDLTAFNRIISQHNALIRQHNSLVIRIESLSDNILEVKGKAIGKNITKVKTYYQDGKKIVEKENRDEMDKIEIYGFEGNMNQLKAVLAHEIAHLVGINHIEKKGALMNPILQSNQVERMELTSEDIKAFNQLFRDRSEFRISTQ